MDNYKVLLLIIHVRGMSIKYINLPIYSVAVNGEYIYFAGGGGGSTGIPNEIKIYHRNITPEPANAIATGKFIIQNLTVYEEKNLVVCNANDHVIVYRSLEGGKMLEERYRFKADFSQKDATINSICISSDGEIVCTGGDDMVIRFFRLGEKGAVLESQYAMHTHPIKSVDHNQGNLYLSNDNSQIIIFDLSKKKVIRTIFQDQFLPQKSMFQSAYFYEKGSSQLIITHFIFKQATYVTKEVKGKFQTVQIADDQSCQTAYHRQNKVLGIACGNGTTIMFDSKSMSGLGRQKNHKFVITGCTITKKTGRFLTGTPQCSYHVQNRQGEFNFNWKFMLNIVVCFLIIYLLGSKNLQPTLDLQL